VLARVGSLERNVRLYPRYAGLFNGLFWLPVFFLYFLQRLPLQEVLLMESLYYGAVVLLEVPSGYVSDVLGRRAVLLMGALSLVLAYGTFCLGTSFSALAVAQALLAVGVAFNSGSDTSFHYDSLTGLGRREEFAAREAVVARVSLVSGAVAALVGGVVGAFDLRLAYALSLVGAVLMVLHVIAFVEPAPQRPDTARGFVHHLGACMGHLRNSSLRWLTLFAVLMTVLNHVPYELYQPYLRLVGKGSVLTDTGVPAVAGVHVFLTMLVGAWAAHRSVRLRDRIGLARTLLLCALVQVMIIAAIGAVLSLPVVGLVLLRGVPRGLMTAPLSAAVAPLVGDSTRATFLSLQSLAGRLAFSGVLFALASFLPDGGAVDWPSVALMARASTVLGVVGIVMLALSAGALSLPESEGEG